MARIGKRSDNDQEDLEQVMIPMARIGRRNDYSMIPMARIGKRTNSDDSDLTYHIPMPRIG